MAVEQPSLFDAPQLVLSPFLVGGPSLQTGQSLRDQGTTQVLDNAGGEWADQAISCIRRHWSGREGIAEDFRRTCMDHGLRPHHPNAWGALTLQMKRQKLLEETGEWRAPKDRKSHARPTRVYRVR